MAKSRWSDPVGMRTKNGRKRKTKHIRRKWEDVSDLMPNMTKSDIDTSHNPKWERYLEVNNSCWRMTITPSDISTPMLTAAEF